jgi:hypothetical protein
VNRELTNESVGIGVQSVGLVGLPREERERLYAAFTLDRLTDDQRELVRVTLVDARDLLALHHTNRHANSRDPRTGRQIHDLVAWELDLLAKEQR